jgi:hypothetical protein
VGIYLSKRRAEQGTCLTGRFWLALIAAAMLCPLAGCAAMNLLQGKLPAGDEDDLGLATRPYPAWDGKAKEALDRIPTVGKEQPSAAPASTVNATPSLPPNNDTTTVTHEQPQTANPAASAAPTAPNSPPPAKAVEAFPSPAPLVNPHLVNELAAAAGLSAPALVHPTHEHPLAVTGAEAIPVTPSPPTTMDKKKPEPTAAERLSALIKQRSEFLSTLKAEVNRRRTSTEDDEELTRLEKELRLVQLAGEQPDEAVRQIEALDGPERDAFAHLLMGLATWMNTDEARRPTLRNAKIVREIRDAAAELAAASKLDVRNLAFCEKVESYGSYKQFSRNQFKSKQEVLLYAEVENFTAVRVADESYETKLQGSYQIFDSRGGLVDERELLLDNEFCRNYRRDYFLAYRIYLPEDISPGDYRLELHVEDKLSTAAHPEPEKRRGEKEKSLAKAPSSASSYKGRKLGTGTIEFTIK